jgi:hypothetical protein
MLHQTLTPARVDLVIPQGATWYVPLRVWESGSPVDPPAGVSSACADAYAGAKWDSTGAGQAWTTPGARGIGTDVTAASAVVTVPVNGTQTVTVPLGSVVAGCAAAGECVIVLDADHHVWEYQGTFSLFYDCAFSPRARENRCCRLFTV